MWKKVKTVIVTALAVLGVLFIILMLIPDDEDDAAGTEIQETQAVQESQESVADEPQETQASHENQEVQGATDTQEEPEAQDTPQLQDYTEEMTTDDQNAATAAVNIPASEISDKKLKFTTKTLDGKKVDQDIFSDYDITLVHVWGTYCGPCIKEMGKYANCYETMPKNVNLIGIVCDVYDGIDNNIDDADKILGDAGAVFMNLRTSDSVYDVIDGIQLIPSSFFVDREGHIIGEIMMGQGYDATISRLNGYLI